MHRVLCVLALMGFMACLSAHASGLRGQALVRLPGGGIGAPIPAVSLSFVKEDSSASFSTTTDANGQYAINLDPGRYYWLATHGEFEDASSAPGVVVVSANQHGTANVFLREPQITTVLIVRHAEKLNPNSTAPDEPLSPNGMTRAGHLRDALLRSGVTSVHSTNMVRTLSTVKPLADTFRLPTQPYSGLPALASDILAQHRGDVVLVAAHSNTVSQVIDALGAQVRPDDSNDFDNLYVVTVVGNESNAVNLQYGVDSPPDNTKNARHAMTLLLVGQSGAGPDPQDLLHAARKAGVTRIFTSSAGNPLLTPLANALNLSPTTFNGNDIPAFAHQLVSNHSQDTAVVAGTNDQLRELIRQLGGHPFPIIYASDTDHLILVTRFPSGAIRVVPMRF
jgi:broad specificity phosphatase PhoE